MTLRRLSDGNCTITGADPSSNLPLLHENSKETRKTRLGATPLSPSARELHDANNTLNAFVGGKQKSWMGGNQDAPIIRATQRQNAKIQETISTVVAQTETTGLPSVLTEQESVSTSKTSAPIQEVSAEIVQNVVENDSVLPSPAPSHSPPTMPFRRLERTGCQDQLVQGVSRSPDKSDSQFNDTPATSIWSRKRHSNTILEELNRPPKRAASISADLANSENSSSHVGNSTATYGRRASMAGSPVSPLNSPFPTQNFSPVNTPVPSPTQSSMPVGLLRNSPLSSLSQTLVANIDDFKARIANIGEISDHESSRLNLLRKAVLADDWFFLYLHQTHVAQSYCPQALNESTGLPLSGLPGWKTIEHFLESHNKFFSDHSMQFFSSFPWSLRSGQLKQPASSYFLKRISEFAAREHLNLLAIGNWCVKNSRRLLPEELEAHFKLKSPIFMEVVATRYHCEVNWRLRIHAATPDQNLNRRNSHLTSYSESTSLVPPLILPSNTPIISQRNILDHQLGPQYMPMVQQISNDQILPNMANQGTPAIPTTTTIYPPTQRNVSGTSQQVYSQTTSYSSEPTRQRSPSVAANSPYYYGGIQVGARRINQTGISALSQLPNRRQSQPFAIIEHSSLNHAPTGNTGYLVSPPNTHTAPMAIPSLPLPKNMLQAHLTSPVMTDALHPDTTNPARRLHLSITNFPVKGLKLTRMCQTRSWEVSETDEKNLSRVRVVDQGCAPKRTMVVPGSTIYRLRCVQVKKGQKVPTEDSEWVIKETIWAKGVFAEINGHRIEFRRKSQWGKDLPTDITNYIRGGNNQLKIVRMDNPKDDRGPEFFVRVELFRCMDEETVKSRLCRERLISQQKAKAEIVRRLSLKINSDDIIVESNTVIVDIFCPLSAKRVDLPVRGKACLHLECFDFETYIMSRPRKREGEPPHADAYICPLCKGDARPEELVIDGFLLEVLKKLKVEHHEEVRSIIIDRNGNWKVKLEKEERDEKSRVISKVETGQTQKNVEIICLDD